MIWVESLTYINVPKNLWWSNHVDSEYWLMEIRDELSDHRVTLERWRGGVNAKRNEYLHGHPDILK